MGHKQIIHTQGRKAEKKLLGKLNNKCKGKAPLKETKRHMRWHKNMCDTMKFLRNTKYERGMIYGSQMGSDYAGEDELLKDINNTHDQMDKIESFLQQQ